MIAKLWGAWGVGAGISCAFWGIRGCCGPLLRYVSNRLCSCSLKAIMRLWSSRCMLSFGYDGVVLYVF